MESSRNLWKQGIDDTRIKFEEVQLKGEKRLVKKENIKWEIIKAEIKEELKDFEFPQTDLSLT